ncbi:hypothetical protein ACLMJK_006597 [Lecanora helva]
MSMAFCSWPFLYLLLLPLTWAGPPSTGFLTPALQEVVPACAQTCLEFFIAENFPSSTCGPPPNFDCLCRSDSISGFTIGEGALECFFTGCGSIYDARAYAVYDVCSTVQNAKPNTHGTLTATISPVTPKPPANPAHQTTTHNQSPTFTARSSVKSTLSSLASSSGTSLISFTSPSSSSSHSSSAIESFQSITSSSSGIIVSATPPPPTSSAPSTASAAPVSSSAPALTKPQIAGVVVASVGAAAVGFGVLFLIFCLRRRRKQERRQSGSSFGGDKIIGSEETTPDMAAIAARDFEYEHEHQSSQPLIPPRQQRSPTRPLRLETPASSSESGWDQYHREFAPNPGGLAPGPRQPRSKRDDHSPITPASNRTRNSQLLPDKPTYSLFPRNSIPNQTIRQPGSSPKPAVPPLGSPFTRAAPQHPRSVDTSQAELQGSSVPNNPDSDPFIATANRSPRNMYPYFQNSRPRPPRPSTRRGPPRYRIPSWEQPPSAGVVRKPVPIYQPYRAQNGDPESSHGAENQGITRTISHRRKPLRKQSAASRPETYFSIGSETSFESLDDDDDEGPDPRSALSPVAEMRSPPKNGRVSYPAIPVSASESPTRRAQVRPAHPGYSDSLLSKRLGQDKAREIASRLQSPSRRSSEDNNTRQSAKWKTLISPGLKGTDKSGSPPSAKGAIKSPTPWRR